MLTVTSLFLNEMTSTNPSSLYRQFTFTGSDFSAKVLSYGTLNRRGSELISGGMQINLSNADQYWNVLKTDAGKAEFFNEGVVKFGFANNSGGTDTITVFTGKMIKASPFGQATTTLAFTDSLLMLRERTIGNQASAVAFVTSNWNPADLFWTIATCYGELSTVASTSNPDIDYSTWQTWHTDLDTLNIKIRANFPGSTLVEAMQNLGSITDSTINAEGDGKIYARRNNPTVLSSAYTLNDTTIIKTGLDISTDGLINDATILFNYNVSSSAWSGVARMVNTSSVNTYGRFAKDYTTDMVWHVDSVSANSFLERKLAKVDNPVEELTITTVLAGMRSQVRDNIQITTANLSYNAENFEVDEINLNLDEGLIDLTLIKGQRGADYWFFLDDSVQGLLDKSYNHLY